ncbi:uncharacterized protein K452DRAFT_70269 [Aplosporella prunicola CBS 121167]|uniref:Uncharacterized protein n=1 Tax=Aplosporella prunicola CBS 121167 TaxID=1176127 RepID=A0A6A6BVP1_9PEZI|nr:uncharacterized protein K452DRAFT_70269 [Aplosporella prunicola CBS 121167]KAF2146761.1 hypothetical protein K452DRAFT_70269 [Aplosporella prunicola CBS 121167]
MSKLGGAHGAIGLSYLPGHPNRSSILQHSDAELGHGLTAQHVGHRLDGIGVGFARNVEEATHGLVGQDDRLQRGEDQDGHGQVLQGGQGHGGRRGRRRVDGGQDIAGSGIGGRARVVFVGGQVEVAAGVLIRDIAGGRATGLGSREVESWRRLGHVPASSTAVCFWTDRIRRPAATGQVGQG